MKLQLTRDVSRKECPWLSRKFKKGETVHLFQGYTYGVISDAGTACTLESDGAAPFFELPTAALSAGDDAGGKS